MLTVNALVVVPIVVFVNALAWSVLFLTVLELSINKASVSVAESILPNITEPFNVWVSVASSPNMLDPEVLITEDEITWLTIKWSNDAVGADSNLLDVLYVNSEFVDNAEAPLPIKIPSVVNVVVPVPPFPTGKVPVTPEVKSIVPTLVK